MVVVDLQTAHSAAMEPCEHTGFDNGFNLPELSLGPMPDLYSLHTLIQSKVSTLASHLANDNLGLTNFSAHPFTSISDDLYNSMCLPRPIYQYWREVRGWNHKSGINAKASIQSSFGVDAARAVDALNVMIGFAPAFIAIYANSPFEEGKLTGNVENRLTLWNRMFENCIYPTDRDNGTRTSYFHSLREYFDWLYGENLIHAVPVPITNYKESDDLFAPVRPVTYNDFFSADEVECVSINSGERRRIVPSISHYEYFQFARFTDARIRFHLNDNFKVSEFNHKLDHFDEIAKTIYIEFRSPGTNLPDKWIREVAGDRTADSVIISVCAIMKGLICNLKEALQYLPDDLVELRSLAIRESVANKQVQAFATRMINIAEKGLDNSEKWMLSYPEFVLETGRSNGVRAIEDYQAGKTLRDMVLDRLLYLP